MKKFNVIGVLGLILSLTILGACSHEETYTHKPYQPIYSPKVSALEIARDTQSASGIINNVKDTDVLESASNHSEAVEEFELAEHWANIIGKFRTKSGAHLSTLEVDDTFKIKASLHALEGDEETALNPDFPDPLFYDDDTKTFYTRGTVIIHDDVNIEVELYLKMNEDNELLNVSVMLIPQSNTKDIDMTRVKED